MKWERIKNCRRVVLFTNGWILFFLGTVWIMEDWGIAILGFLFYFGGIAFLYLGYNTKPNSPLFKNIENEMVYKEIYTKEGLTRNDLWQSTVDFISHYFDITKENMKQGYIETEWIARGYKPKRRSRIILKFLGKEWNKLRIKCESEYFGLYNYWSKGRDPELLERVHVNLMDCIGITKGLMKID